MSITSIKTPTPIASNAASLGVTNQPAITSPPAATPTAPVSTVAAPATGAQATTTKPAGNATVSTSYDPTPVSGGGVLSDFMGNAVSKLAAFAQNSMTNVQKAMQADMTANNGQVDPAKLQQYSMQMSTYEMIMQMAQKIQEKQEAATQVWLRP